MSNPKGKINLPGNNASVPRHFQAGGTIADLPPGQHLFLVVEVEGLMWPKGEAQLQNMAWTCDVYEGGDPPGGRFALSLFAIGGQGFETVTAWLERGKATDSYPGMEHIPQGIRLHSIRLRLAG